MSATAKVDAIWGNPWIIQYLLQATNQPSTFASQTQLAMQNLDTVSLDQWDSTLLVTAVKVLKALKPHGVIFATIGMESCHNVIAPGRRWQLLNT